MKNQKIEPCSIHRKEFNCSTFFNINAADDDLPKVLESGVKYDSYRFDISDARFNIIPFRVCSDRVQILTLICRLGLFQLLDLVSEGAL